MSRNQVKALLEGRGHYAVLPSFRHLMAPHGNVWIAQASDEDELRFVIRTICESCAANGIYDISHRTLSTVAAAIIKDVFDEYQRASTMIQGNLLIVWDWQHCEADAFNICARLKAYGISADAANASVAERRGERYWALLCREESADVIRAVTPVASARDDEELRVIIRALLVGALAAHGGDHTTTEQVDNINLKTTGGSGSTYTLRRLKRDNPRICGLPSSCEALYEPTARRYTKWG